MNSNLTKPSAIQIEGEKFYYNLSFDINDFIGDGIWWLQIYDDKQNLIYDEPYASSQSDTSLRNISSIIREDVLAKKGT